MSGPNRYQPLRDAQREALETNETSPVNQPEPIAPAPEPEFLNALDLYDAARAAKQAEVDERYEKGKINSHERRYEMLRWESEPLGKLREDNDPARNENATAARTAETGRGETTSANQPEPAALAPEPEFLNALDLYDAARAAKQAEVDERYEKGKINSHERRYEMLRWESEPLGNLREDNDPARSENVIAARTEETGRGETTEAILRSPTETQRAEAEHRFSDNREMTDAQREKLDRMLGSMYRDAGNELTRNVEDGLSRPDREYGE